MSTIYFVGAGPGDPELITYKGIRLLQIADIVIYDRLVNPLLLLHCTKTCELQYVGKIPHGQATLQPQINQSLVAAAARGEVIVRLKGGDPLIFGRLKEEITAVTAANISYQIVPGVTAASGAAAYSGFPLTERKVATAVTFATGHGSHNQAIVNCPVGLQQTLCYYMGIEHLPVLMADLLEKLAEDQPVAVIQWGTHGCQQVIEGRVSTIARLVATASITNPAVVIVGKVAANRQHVSWFEAMPYRFCNFLIVSTQPPDLERLLSITRKAGNPWWIQVGPRRDQRFDSITDRFLAEYEIDDIIYDGQIAFDETRVKRKKKGVDYGSI